MVNNPDYLTPNSVINLKSFESHLARYALAAEFVKSKAVLDVACGWGYGSRYLFDKGAKTVVGGDISADVINCAHTYWARQGTEFTVINATIMPFADNSFDVVVSMETIEHLEHYEIYLSECKRVLKSGGVFICSTPNIGYGATGLKKVRHDHVHEFSPREFRTLLSRFFRETHLNGQDYWQEGEGKTGWKIKFKVAMWINDHLPKVYKVVEHISRISFMRGHYARLNEIKDWDKVLTGKYNPTPLVDNGRVPKDMIAVARK